MIPTNSNNITNCDPMSSNCVIWQGPDLTCVSICQGDTISDVVSAMCDQLVILQSFINTGISFDISNINQTLLTGTPATNLEELIQLIIDNIISNQGGGGSAGSSYSCAQVMACGVTVPKCFEDKTQFTSGGSLSSFITSLTNLFCTTKQNVQTNTETIGEVAQRVTKIEQEPQGEPNPRIFSSGVVTKNVLTPLENVVQALDSQFIQLRSTTGTASNISTGVNAAPADIATPVSTKGYTKTIDINPITGGDSLYNVWVALDDTRRAIADIQANCCNTVQLQRMSSINAFYASGANCAASLTAAATASNCFDIWNSTGVQFDSTVRAYTSPYLPGSETELSNGKWYALCATGPMAQYSVTAPHWNTPISSCG